MATYTIDELVNSSGSPTATLPPPNDGKGKYTIDDMMSMEPEAPFEAPLADDSLDPLGGLFPGDGFPEPDPVPISPTSSDPREDPLQELPQGPAGPSPSNFFEAKYRTPAIEALEEELSALEPDDPDRDSIIADIQTIERLEGDDTAADLKFAESQQKKRAETKAKGGEWDKNTKILIDRYKLDDNAPTFQSDFGAVKLYDDLESKRLVRHGKKLQDGFRGTTDETPFTAKEIEDIQGAQYSAAIARREERESRGAETEYAANETVRTVAGRMPFLGGFSSALDLISIGATIKRINSGHADQGDYDLMLDYMQTQEDEKNKGWFDKVLDLGMDVPGFMVEFAATGSAATWARKGTEKLLTKLAGKYAKKTAVKVGVGIASRTAAGVAHAAAMPQMTAENAARRMKDGASLYEAMTKGYGDTFVEVFSEALGQDINVVGKWLGSKTGAAAFGDAIARRWMMKTGKGYSAFLDAIKKGGYNGVVTEVLEERAGDVMRGASGLQPDYGVTGDLAAGATGDMDRLKKGLYQLSVELTGFSIIPGGGAAANKVVDWAQGGPAYRNAIYGKFLHDIGETKEGYEKPKTADEFMAGRAEQEAQHPGAEAFTTATAAETVITELEKDLKDQKSKESELTTKIDDSTKKQEGVKDTKEKAKLQRERRTLIKERSKARRRINKIGRDLPGLRDVQAGAEVREKEFGFEDDTAAPVETGDTRRVDLGAEGVPLGGEAAGAEFFGNNDLLGYQDRLRELRRSGEKEEAKALKSGWANASREAKKARKGQRTVVAKDEETEFKEGQQPVGTLKQKRQVHNDRVAKIRSSLREARRTAGPDSELVRHLEDELETLKAEGPVAPKISQRKPYVEPDVELEKPKKRTIASKKKPTKVQTGIEPGGRGPGTTTPPAGTAAKPKKTVVKKKPKVAPEAEAGEAVRQAGKGIVSGFYDSVRDSIAKTGDVPGPEKRSPLGRLWKGAKSVGMSGDEFVDLVRTKQPENLDDWKKLGTEIQKRKPKEKKDEGSQEAARPKKKEGDNKGKQKGEQQGKVPPKEVARVPNISNASELSQSSARSWLRDAISRSPEGVDSSEGIANWIIKIFGSEEKDGVRDVPWVARAIDETGKTPTTRERVIRLVESVQGESKPPKTVVPKKPAATKKPTIRSLTPKNLTPAQKRVAKIIHGLVGDMEVEVIEDDDPRLIVRGQKANGKFLPPQGGKPAKITVSKSATKNNHTVLHEGAHGAFWTILQDYYKSPGKLTAKQENALTQIEKLVDYAYENAPQKIKDTFAFSYKADTRGVADSETPLDEFISELAANTKFQDYLKSLKTADGSSWWEEFKNWVREVLGGNAREASDMLDALIGNLEEAAGAIPAREGNATKIHTENMEPIDAVYAAVELADLIPSHIYAPPKVLKLNPEYPDDNIQPRDYQWGNDEYLKLERHKDKKVAEHFVNNDPGPDRGPPTITRDGVVLNGNGRTLVLKYLGEEDDLGWYQTVLEADAKQYGVSVEGMKQPVLVRIVGLDPNSEIASKFAGAGNVSPTQSQGVLRKAASLKRLVGNDVLDSVPVSEESTFSATISGKSKSAKEFRRRLQQAIPEVERGTYFKDGKLTGEGVSLVRSMLLLRVLPLETVEQLQSQKLQWANAIEGAVPQLLTMRNKPTHPDIVPTLVEALNWMFRNPQVHDKASLNDAFVQKTTFDNSISDAGKMLAEFLLNDANKVGVFRKKLVKLALESKDRKTLFDEDRSFKEIVAEVLQVKMRPDADFGPENVDLSPYVYNAKIPKDKFKNKESKSGGIDDLFDDDELSEPRDFHPKIRANLTPQQMEKGRLMAKNTAKALTKLRVTEPELEALARAGAGTRRWYQRSTKMIRDAFGEDADRFISVLAATSPRSRVRANMQTALAVWSRWDTAFRPTDTQEIKDIIEQIPRWLGTSWTNNTIAALQAEDPRNVKFSDRSQKVQPFYGNLMGNLEDVTIDGWMAQIAGLPETLNGAQYRALSVRIRRVADRMGWKPAEVQAAIWNFTKALASITEEGETTTESLPRLTEGQVGQVDDFATIIRENENVRRAVINARGHGGSVQLLRPKTRRRSALRRQTGKVLTRATDPGSLRGASKRLPEHKKGVGRTASRTAAGVKYANEALTEPADAREAKRIDLIASLVGQAAEKGVTKFADFAMDIAKQYPTKMGTLGPYLQRVWNEGRSAGLPLDEARNVDSVLGTAKVVGTVPKKKLTGPLAAYGLEVVTDTARGKKIWRVKGQGTFDNKDLIKELGGRFDGQEKNWRFYDRDPTDELKTRLDSESDENQPGDDGVGDEDVGERRRAAIRRGNAYDEGSGKPDHGSSVSQETKDLIQRGINHDISQETLDNQVEDVGAIKDAYVNKRPFYVLGNAPGTGKTFVLGGVIKELRAEGAKRFVYVTQNQPLIEQVRDTDLADYGMEGVEFVTYSWLSTNGAKDSKGAVLIFDEAHGIKNIQLNDDHSAKAAVSGREMMNQAEFTILSTATPFENPAEARYLSPTGIFDDHPDTILKRKGGDVVLQGFDSWAVTFGAEVQTKDGKLEALYWNRVKNDVPGLVAANDWFTSRGVYTHRPMRLPDGMLKTSFYKVQAEQKYVDVFKQVEDIYEDAKANADRPFDILKHEMNTKKRILEASKIEAAVERARELVGKGKQVILFVNTKADTVLDKYRLSGPYRKYRKIGGKEGQRLYDFHEIMDEMQAWEQERKWAQRQGKRVGPAPFAGFIVEIAAAYHRAKYKFTLPSVIDDIMERFKGEQDVVEYTGRVSPKQAGVNLAKWKSGNANIIVATIDKGGTGLSFHDTTGDMPERVQVNISLPWSGTKVEQVSGRLARQGTAKPVTIEWAFAENIPFEGRLAAIVGARMRSMRAIVQRRDDADAVRVRDQDVDPDAPKGMIDKADKPKKKILGKDQISVARQATNKTIGEGEAKNAIAAADIIKSWESMFGIKIQPVTQPNMGRGEGSAGLYHVLEEAILVGAPYQAELAVAIHEIAHHLDKQLGLTGKTGKQNVGKATIPSNLQFTMSTLDYDNAGRMDEGWAEFIRMMVTEDGHMVPQELVDWYHGDFKKKYPKEYGKLRKAEVLARQFADQDVWTRIGVALRGQLPKEVKWHERFKTSVDHWKTNAQVWSHNNLYNLDKIDAYMDEHDLAPQRLRPGRTALVYRLTEVQKADAALRHGVQNFNDGHQIGKQGLWDVVVKNTRNEADQKKAIGYALARHVLFMAQKNPKYRASGISKDDAQVIIDQVPASDQARYKKVANGIAQYGDDLLQMQMEAGVISQEEYERMVSYYSDGKNPRYFPLLRVKKKGTKTVRSSLIMFDSTPAMKRRSKVGSDAEIMDPLESLAAKSVEAYARAASATVTRSLVEALDPRRQSWFKDKKGETVIVKGMEGFGGFLIRQKPGMKGYGATIEEMLRDLMENGIVDEDMGRDAHIAAQLLGKLDSSPSEANQEWFAERHGLDPDEIDMDAMREAAEELPDVMSVITTYRPVFQEDAKHTTVVYRERKGSFTLYKLDKNLYDLARDMKKEEVNPFIRILEAMMRLFKTGAIALNTSFGGQNPVRDYQAYLERVVEAKPHEAILNPIGHAAGLIWYHGLRYAGIPLRDNPYYEFFREMSGGQYTRMGREMSQIGVEVKRMTNRSVLGWAKGLPHTLWSDMQSAVALSDVPPRMTEMVASMRNDGWVADKKSGKWLNIATNTKHNQLPEYVRVHAMHAAGSATVNFKIHGTGARKMELILPLYNASMQGIVREMSLLTNAAKHPAGIKKSKSLKVTANAAKLARYTWMFMAANFAIGYAREMLKWDDDDERERERWQDKNYWVTEVGGYDVRIPFSREGTIFVGLGSFLANALLRVSEKDPKRRSAIDMLKAEVVDKLPLGGGPIRALVEAGWDKDFFRQRPVEPPYKQMRGKRPELPQNQYWATTSSASLALGKYVNARTPGSSWEGFGASPAQIEHVLGGATGGIYTRGTELWDAAADHRLTVRHIPVLRGFLMDRESNQSMADFYRLKGEVGTDISLDEDAERESSPALLAKWKTLDDASMLMTDIRQKERKYKSGRRTYEFQSYLTGLAREAMGLKPLESRPSPFSVENPPAGIAEAVKDTADTFANGGVELLGHPQQEDGQNDEAYATEVTVWEKKVAGQKQWLEGHLDSKPVRDAIFEAMETPRFKNMLKPKKTGKPRSATRSTKRRTDSEYRAIEAEKQRLKEYAEDWVEAMESYR